MATTVAKLNVTHEEKTTGNSLTRLALRRVRHDKLTLLALGVVILMTLLAVFAPVISNYLGISYTRTNTAETFLPPGSPGHPLGTDDLGRDHLARLLYAAQVSLSVGFIAALLSLSIGVTLGVLTGF